jgi:CHAD domain-containing protein
VAQGKWLSDLTPTTLVADAARHVLTVRLEVVRDCLPPALEHADEDVEHVHQLRVATRRAGAALRIFSACLPEKAFRAARKALRRLRRAAGAARDWDVFLESLAALPWPASDKRRPALDFLVGFAVAQRAAAQDTLRAACPDHPFALDRLLARTVAAVHRPHGPSADTLLDLARPWLGDLLRQLDAAVACDLEDYDNLHRVRILGKRLRYAMEVFANCFEPAFREEVYPAVEQMQETLGNVNDSHVAGQRLAALRDRLRQGLPGQQQRLAPGLDALLGHHRRRLPRERRRFLAWWKQWQASGGEAAFLALLKTGHG